MDSSGLIRRWHGRVYRHIPASSPYGPLDLRFAARASDDHWVAAGTPSLTFASDPTLLSAELARNFRISRASDLAPLMLTRQVYEIELDLQRVFDLRDHQLTAQLGIANEINVFQDRSVARATAEFVRAVLHAEAILTPSLAAPADPDRWNLILFLDQLERPMDEVAVHVTKSGSIQPGQRPLEQLWKDVPAN